VAADLGAFRPGTIVVLNGTASAGKTSIARALQTQMDEPFLDAGIDRFLGMLPARYLERPLWEDVMGLFDRPGTVGWQLISAMHHAIAALAGRGCSVVADHVMVETAWVTECARLFADLPAYFVAVRCPLDVVVRRERERGDRTLGEARLQYPLVHRHGAYDVEVDTSLMSAVECAAAIRRHIETRPPEAFRALAAA